MHATIFRAHQIQNMARIIDTMTQIGRMVRLAAHQIFYHHRAHLNLEAPISYLTYRSDTIAIGLYTIHVRVTAPLLTICYFRSIDRIRGRERLFRFSLPFFLTVNQLQYFPFNILKIEFKWQKKNNSNYVYSRLSPGDSASTGKTKSHRYCRHAQGIDFIF